MSTHSAIGTIQGGKVSAIYVHYDGYLAGVGKDIQNWLLTHDNDIEAFLAFVMTHDHRRTLDELFPDSNVGDIPYESLEDIAGDVSYAYLFNLDTKTFYACRAYPDVSVMAQASFDAIQNLDMQAIEENEPDVLPALVFETSANTSAQIAPQETPDAKVETLKARIAELEAQVKTLEGQIGLFPVTVYNAYLDTQDTRLSQVPYAMACMSLKDAMSRAILNRPTGYPIVPTGEA